MHRGVPGPPCVQQDPDQAKQNLYGKRWGYDNVLAGMPYEERVFSSSGQIVKRTLTRWTATNTSTFMTSIPSRYAQRNARTLTKETIVYDGDTGLSSATALEYDADQDDAGSSLNVRKTFEFAYKIVYGGGSLSRATSTTTLDDTAPTISDPTQGSTPVKMTEMTYLQNDPNYDSVESNYLAKNLINLPTKTFVKNGVGTVTVAKSEIKYDEASYGNGYRGQPTTVRSWLDTNDSWVETRMKYDTYGNVIEVTDARNNTTTTAYDSTYHAFPVQVTSPIPSDGVHGSSTAFVTSMLYNTVTGLPISTTNANGVETRIEYDDPLLRTTRVAAYNSSNQQIGAATETFYSPGTDMTTRYIKTRSQIDATNWRESYVRYDGLGRAIKSQTVDSNGDVFVETQYDNMSRPYRVSNPYRNGEMVSWTESIFDAAGRPWKTIAPDNAFIETTYSITSASGGNLGTAMTVNDQSGKLRRSITNALGHLTRVDEPTTDGLGSIDAPNQPTIYSYDLLNNLTQVHQPGDSNEECGPTTTTCSQTREFEYDSLSRLKKATNPESGLIQYTYDANGNLITKTDARGIVTTYAYDAINRVKARTYTNEPEGSETPDVSYYYDLVTNAKGKLIKVTNGIGDNRSTTEYAAFDILGRVTRSIQTTDNVTYGGGTDATKWMTYTYNLSGALIEQQYPSGRVVKNVLDGDGGLAEVKSKKNVNHAFWSFANHFSYTAAGAVMSMQLGNGRWESTEFNNRLQPKTIALGRVAPSVNTQGQLVYSTDLLRLDYQYGDLDWDGSVIAETNNGNIAKQTVTVQAVGATPGFTAVQNYDYDSVNRIQIASETLTPTGGSAESWTQEFKYDRYGNRTFNESTTTTLPKNCGTAPNLLMCVSDVPKFNPSVSPSNNRLNGYTFDAAGNTTHDAENRKFTWDGENKQVKVEIVSGSTGMVGEYVYDGDGKRVKKRGYEDNILTEETIFVYDAAGKLIGEYSNQVASSQTAEIAYVTNDHLGSPRINTDINGNVTARHDYHPFGEEIASSKRAEGTGYADDTVRKQFTGYERDGETELDFAQARMYANKLGRFTAVDPIYLKEDRLLFPQQFNLYLYADNNPVKYVDPTGLMTDVTILGADAEKLKDDLNNREDAQFKVKLGADGKLDIIDKEKVNVGNLSSTERAMFDAISDPNHHAVLMGVPQSPVIEFGTFTGDLLLASDGATALNLVDTADMSLLRGASATAAGEAIAHEVMEAYASAKTGSADYKAAHKEASQYFPEPVMGPGASLPGEKGKSPMTGVTNEITYTRPKEDITLKISFKFVTPIPRASVRGHNVGNMTSIEVVRKK